MAGAGYKLFNVGDVLTAAQVNTYLQEQTVMRFASAAARTSALAAVLAEGMMSYLVDTNAVEVYDGANWISVGNTGDITGVTAGTGITGGGTSGTVTITNSMATEIDAKGDLIVGTGADTFSRLAVGATNGHSLQVDSTAGTGLKWAATASPAYTYTSYTPTVTQSSALTLTSSTGAYVVIGDLVQAQFKCEIGSAGTSNNGISLTLPTNASTTTINGSTSMGVGSVVVYRQSASTVYWGFTTIKSANLMEFRSGYGKSISTDAEVWGRTGSDFAFALASGDQINISFSYRKA
jgi:hypothetical protein